MSELQQFDMLKENIIKSLGELAQYKVINEHYIKDKLVPAVEKITFANFESAELLKEHLTAGKNSQIPAKKNIVQLVKSHVDACERHSTSYTMGEAYTRHLEACKTFLTEYEELCKQMENAKIKTLSGTDSNQIVLSSLQP
jgi:hypothetical protein